MNRLTTLAAVVTIAGSVAAPALAHQTRFPTEAPVGAQRVVMMCANDAATRSAFRREHGTPPAFITADQALQARAAGETWSAPRCMTAREHGRLVQTLTTYAAVR
ncbi:hypothetical protein [Brevundimonas sp. NIBR11]|uniref:hypothetical protein n=1 Tax=Brevundimonas sp. NIBR11 TaxID=3015999 RepID=UPI0022F0506B|nr:hypothetical protein [Brevundimonas sp. NIBR11]WGM29819.1 hypothetical protein KKHFBJBL_00021 [Brevundimonas sp. NIBR11]